MLECGVCVCNADIWFSPTGYTNYKCVTVLWKVEAFCSVIREWQVGCWCGLSHGMKQYWVKQLRMDLNVWIDIRFIVKLNCFHEQTICILINFNCRKCFIVITRPCNNFKSEIVIIINSTQRQPSWICTANCQNSSRSKPSLK